MDNISKTVEEVEWDYLCRCLHISYSERRKIEVLHSANSHRRVLVEWWLLTDPAPSWRRIIQRLDIYYSRYVDESCAHAADCIRHNAEPVQGMLSMYMHVHIVGCDYLHILNVLYSIGLSFQLCDAGFQLCNACTHTELHSEGRFNTIRP